MADHSQDFITRIVTLIRDNQVDEARRLLDEAGEQTPENVARWYLFARLLVVSLGEKDIEERLQSFGRAPGHAFRTALSVLKRAVPEVDAPPEKAIEPPATTPATQSVTPDVVDAQPAPAVVASAMEGDVAMPVPATTMAIAGENPVLRHLEHFLGRIRGSVTRPDTAGTTLAGLTQFLARIQTRQAGMAAMSEPDETAPPTWLYQGSRPGVPVAAVVAGMAAHGRNLGQRGVIPS
ncbi:MAG: hypothetical protein H7833_18815 [Magnetococcus sp. DMHC-1]|nr:hypothetical protein [Magnetococcales bacterium]